MFMRRTDQGSALGDEIKNLFIQKWPHSPMKVCIISVYTINEDDSNHLSRSPTIHTPYSP